MRRSILFSIAATLFFLSLAELAVRFLKPPPRAVEAGSVATPKSALYGWHMPLGGIVPFEDPDTGEQTAIQLNSQGWKDVEHTTEKPAGITRILFVGDSVTYGVVPLEKLYSRKVEELLKARGYPSVEVISMGMPGYGTDQTLEVLLREGLSYSPDIVVYQYTSNDIIDNVYPNDEIKGQPQSLFWQKRFRYHVSAGTLVKESLSPPPAHAPSRWRKLLKKSALLTYIKEAREQIAYQTARLTRVASGAEPGSHWKAKPRLGPYAIDVAGHDSPEIREAIAIFRALVAEMKRLSEAAGAHFAVAALTQDEPCSRERELEMGRFSSDETGDYWTIDGKRVNLDRSRRYRELAAVATESGIPLIPRKRRYPRYHNDLHPNAEGNLAMAEDIADFFERWPEFGRLISSRQAHPGNS